MPHATPAGTLPGIVTTACAPAGSPRMHVVHHAHLRCEHAHGEHRLVAACRDQGIAAFEVWTSTLEPGAATPEMRHGGELVAVAHEGAGKLLVDGGPQRFHAPCSLLIPAGSIFQVANNGGSPLRLVWVCTQVPQPVVDECHPPFNQGTSP
jgi:mannose-6-phosphate isomerase-like protein (cupin superfamily)